ncbi:hypothetical protein BJX61DRAFT_539245 [Aspergillus egyptiacus]|nr:hypothetical protein BJX61DRAFT_539245 [Aspergillus egyptiacus]
MHDLAIISEVLKLNLLQPTTAPELELVSPPKYEQEKTSTSTETLKSLKAPSKLRKRDRLRRTLKKCMKPLVKTGQAAAITVGAVVALPIAWVLGTIALVVWHLGGMLLKIVCIPLAPFFILFGGLDDW